MDRVIDIIYNNSLLFNNMSKDEISGVLSCSSAIIKKYQKGEIIFAQGDETKFITVLLNGSVVIVNDTLDGNRRIINMFNKAGDIFGEVFLFCGDRVYENSAYTQADSEVLCMPKQFLYSACGKSCVHHNQITANMLSILANKAYFLNQRIQILSCTSLRQKLVKIIFKYNKNGVSKIPFGREQLAEFLGSTRPSVSRELMNMQNDGLIKVDKKQIRILDFQKLNDII